MCNYLLSAFFLLLSFSISAQGFKADASLIEFKAGNLWVNSVSGTIRGWEGSVNFDRENPQQSTFDVRADLSTIDTGNEKRDEDLRSEDFLHVDKYPDVRFRSLQVNRLQNGSFIVVGQLTLKEVTREVTMPFSASENRLTGEMTIDRFDFNVGTDTGTFLVGREIKITVIAVLD